MQSCARLARSMIGWNIESNFILLEVHLHPRGQVFWSHPTTWWHGREETTFTWSALTQTGVLVFQFVVLCSFNMLIDGMTVFRGSEKVCGECNYLITSCSSSPVPPAIYIFPNEDDRKNARENNEHDEHDHPCPLPRYSITYHIITSTQSHKNFYTIHTYIHIHAQCRIHMYT